MFVQVLMWVYAFVKVGGLIGCILENVVGITHAIDGREPIVHHFMRCLECHLPEFCWSVDKLKAIDYLLPQSRVRIFIRGLRKQISDAVPACLPPFGRKNLKEILGSFPNVVRKNLTLPQQENLAGFEELICEKVSKNLR